MDRNSTGSASIRAYILVALRKESVDRNTRNTLAYVSYNWSLSARRAWIEIMDDFEPSTTRRSLSARRAWIEIGSLDDILAGVNVALRKESVDRNIGPLIFNAQPRSRSPQGERG